jgi:hypothetical protein
VDRSNRVNRRIAFSVTFELLNLLFKLLNLLLVTFLVVTLVVRFSIVVLVVSFATNTLGSLRV